MSTTYLSPCRINHNCLDCLSILDCDDNEKDELFESVLFLRLLIDPRDDNEESEISISLNFVKKVFMASMLITELKSKTQMFVGCMRYILF